MTIFKSENKKNENLNKKNEILNLKKVNLNDICLELSFYILNDKNNLIKYFIHDDVLEWEYRIYLNILELSVLASYDNHRLIYHISDKIPVCKCILDTQNYNTKLLLNELFSFVNSFKEFNFTHGNLHINNIFMDKNKFYIIDFSSSYINKRSLNFNRIANYKRESFLRENDEKFKNKYLNYWDHYTLYVSVNEILNDKCKSYLECLILNYIPEKKLLYLKK